MRFCKKECLIKVNFGRKNLLSKVNLEQQIFYLHNKLAAKKSEPAKKNFTSERKIEHLMKVNFGSKSNRKGHFWFQKKGTDLVKEAAVFDSRVTIFMVS